MGVRGRLLGVAVAAIATLGLSGSALAAVNDYAPQPQSQNFNGGPGGWSFSTDYGGLCIPALTCYTVGSEQVPDDGPSGAGDGFLRVDLFAIANAVTETNAILSSPTFKYKGAGGDKPKKLTFTMDRRTDLGALLPVIADNATYTVKATEVGGASQTLIDTTTMEGAEDLWTSVPKVNLDTDALNVGGTYQLEIVSTFAAGVTVIGTGSADYDNVKLTARGGGGGGGQGGNAGPGAGFTTAIKNLIGNATLKGKRLLVPVGCPRFVAPKTCKLKVVAKLRKTGRPATKPARLRVKPGAKKIARLKVKRAYQIPIESRKRVTVKVKASFGGKKRNVIKRVRIRHG